MKGYYKNTPEDDRMWTSLLRTMPKHKHWDRARTLREGGWSGEAVERKVDFLIAADDSNSLPSQTGVIADDSPR